MTEVTADSTCIVETKDGPVRGYIKTTQEGIFYKFKSIPYASPPIDRLRFLPPKPCKPWTDVKDCTRDAPLPIQYVKDVKAERNCSIQFLQGAEDCLYLEICTPNLKPDKPLPVVFWMGCYKFAFAMDKIYDPTLLNAEDVVYVRCGFRVGPFGFLSINEFTAPGNCGLKDIVMALKWLQRNICYFGGDANNVTIFGNSAGGAIVHLMILSPMATGLFHKAIMQSASALNNWVIAVNPCQPVMELGELLGIHKAHKSEIVDELRTMPAEAIMEAFLKMMGKDNTQENDYFIDGIFKPCIEYEFEGQSAFLTRSPASLLKAGNFNKVPLIIGSNNVEGAIIEYYKKDFYDCFEKYNLNKELLVPKSLAADPDYCKSIGSQLLKFYLGGEEQLTEDTKMQYIQLISDYYFLYYVNKTVRLHKQNAPGCPVYYYIVSNAGEWDVPQWLEFMNTSGHVAEFPLIFRIKLPGQRICKGSKDSVNTRTKVVKMWTNFAKYGNPTPNENDPLLQIKWDPVESKDKLNYLSIGTELTKGINPFRERMAFWDDLHKEHVFLRALVYFNDLGVSW